MPLPDSQELGPAVRESIQDFLSAMSLATVVNNGGCKESRGPGPHMGIPHKAVPVATNG